MKTGALLVDIAIYAAAFALPIAALLTLGSAGVKRAGLWDLRCCRPLRDALAGAGAGEASSTGA